MNDKDKLTANEIKVLAIIPYGAKEPIKTKEIQTRTGLEIRTIRKIISHLITEHNIKIGAIRTGKEQGYFIATNRQELELAIRPLQAQINDMNRRIVSLKENAYF
ncbi:hypothetical protein H5991_04690 [Ligilactobacillus agilis]|uniref:hypothetical protein n=1 Tax=Ligilactobacillus agilis TaxID=1601 RepID=UPI0019563ED1|nr:hypothetical protein [Ligilactobacillus agilis]MBM6772797.1 hypothetical protein [Ligilactobacillus agilis]